MSLDSDNALVRQFGKLDQQQREWQPQVTAALDGLRARLMPQYFGTQAVRFADPARIGLEPVN
jgi:hypothetical protein